MTAFIIDSYKTLSPDSGFQTVQLLTQLVTKNYTVSRGFINSTAPSSTLPFEPPPHALTINRLWFSSLILTLATASIGILIKQWLREYKGVNTSMFAGLLARIRIRQLREPTLKKWKVFEIAGALPLLIQTALLLFFVGMCYFTRSIHVSIGQSSISFVAGWAFFIAATAFAPVVSSDCPWKVTSFLSVLTWARTWLCRVPGLRWLYIGPTKLGTRSHALLFWRLAASVRRVWRSLVALRQLSTWKPLPQAILGRIQVASETAHSSPLWIASQLLLGWIFVKERIRVASSNLIMAAQKDLGIDVGDTDSSEAVVGGWWKLANGIMDALEELERKYFEPLEEEDVAKSDKKDVDILTTVDDAILDDELLRVTMKPTLIQLRPEPAAVIRFVKGALKHRVPQLSSLDLNKWFPFSDLSSLTTQTWEALESLLLYVVERELSKKPVQKELPAWITDTFLIMASRADISRDRHLMQAFGSLCRRHQLRWISCNPDAMHRLFNALLRDSVTVVPQEFEDFDRVYKAVCDLYGSTCCNSGCKHKGANLRYFEQQVAIHDPSRDTKSLIVDIISPLAPKTKETREQLSSAACDLWLAVSAWIPWWAWSKITLPCIPLQSAIAVDSEYYTRSASLTVLALRYLTSIPFADINTPAGTSSLQNDRSSEF